MSTSGCTHAGHHCLELHETVVEVGDMYAVAAALEAVAGRYDAQLCLHLGDLLRLRAAGASNAASAGQRRCHGDHLTLDEVEVGLHGL